MIRVTAEEAKRFLDLWKGDAEFRQQFLEQPRATLLNWGLPQSCMAIHPFCIEQAQDNPQLAGLEEIFGLEAYRDSIQGKSRWLKNYYALDSGNPGFESWRLRQMSRFRAQVSNAWARRNPHLPFAVELTSGCSLSCPFCAGSAQRLSPDIPAFSNHHSFFVELLAMLRQRTGLAKAAGLLYFFTEPFDHPEYEQYLAEAARIWGLPPQTTTAAWFRDPQRTRNFIEYAKGLGMPYNRFSINSPKQLHQCLNLYSPLELLHVELVLNYPEAVAPPLCASGRGQGMENAIPGSIACVSGFLFNLPRKTIRLISPSPDIQRWPYGYRVFEEAAISSLADLEHFLNHCQQGRFNAVLHEASPLKLRPDLLLTGETGQWFLSGYYRRFPLSRGEKYMIDQLEQAKTVDELLRHPIPGMTETQAFARLQVWWANGILED